MPQIATHAAAQGHSRVQMGLGSALRDIHVLTMGALLEVVVVKVHMVVQHAAQPELAHQADAMVNITAVIHALAQRHPRLLSPKGKL